MDQTSQQKQPTILELAASEAARKEIYCDMIINIVKQQSMIIGPALAIEQTKDIEGLQYNPATSACTITGNGAQIVDTLIEKYRDFFGHAAIEVCRDAAAKFLVQMPAEQVPSLLMQHAA